MKDNDNSKILLALLGGVAIGVAIGYFLNSDKKDELVDAFKDKASKLKENLAEGVEDFKNATEEFIKKNTA
jgi:hypothetical protein